METTRLFDILDHCKASYPNKQDSIAGKENGSWICYSIHQYADQADLFSNGLLSMNLKKGDIIATISNNRPEWNIIDMGMMQVGVVHLPVYPTISAEDYKFIFQHAAPRILIVSDKSLFDKVSPLLSEIPSIEFIFSINEIEGFHHWSEIIEKGKVFKKENQQKLEQVKASIVPDDLATLIYTSGTTGFPKGVMLSHRNLMSNVLATIDVHELGEHSRVLSFLPLCHIYERMLNYHFQYKGLSIYYAENIGTISDNLKEVHPHIFASVPRVIELFYDKIIAKGNELKGIKSFIFFMAVKHGLKYSVNHSDLYGLILKVYRKLVFSKWREALGGNLEIIVSGGAALQPRLGRIFGAAGIVVAEGYGLTETSPVLAVSHVTRKEIMYGTVGPILPNVTVKIAPDGEILCKGPNVMLGYYKDPEATREVIDEQGWFHTGDVGVFIDNKYLKITDRKKEIFKLSSGKYVAPQVIENKLKESFLIEQAFVIGENQKFVSTLISPNFKYLHQWASQHKVYFRDNVELIKKVKVLNLFQKEVNEINQTLGQFEQIKRFRIVLEEWTPQSGELSPTLKLKRKILYEKYKTMIDEIFRTAD